MPKGVKDSKEPTSVPKTQSQGTPKSPRDWKEIGQAYGLMVLGGTLGFLGFIGFGIWPLALIAFVPALVVVEHLPGTRGWAFFRRTWVFGYVTFYGGFYWIVNTIVDFGGFPHALAILFASIYFLYQGLQYVLMLFLYRKARTWGASPTPALVGAFLCAELLFPQLFDNFYGNSFFLPELMQVVDLGGPMMLSALAVLGSGAIYEAIAAKIQRRTVPRVPLLIFAGYFLFCFGYSTYRIQELETRMANAPHITVGTVQTAMGIFEKRDNPMEGRRRHIEQSLELEDAHHPDLIVWPESAATFFIPEGINLQRAVFTAWDSGRVIRTPTIMGGLSRREVDGQTRHYNTAFLVDAHGDVQATYDKTYLLAFGEYIPFGETFPQLYEASPNTGHFTPGNHVRAMNFRDYRLSTLICYEDILPAFVRHAVAENNPHLLVNITNDAWFGETQEPYIHLALAAFRAAEHHRYLIRATNTGVSAIIDPTGRIVEESPLFERSNLVGEVAMLEGHTVYESVGDWPAYLSLAFLLGLGIHHRRKRRSIKPATPAQT